MSSSCSSNRFRENSRLILGSRWLSIVQCRRQCRAEIHVPFESTLSVRHFPRKLRIPISGAKFSILQRERLTLERLIESRSIDEHPLSKASSSTTAKKGEHFFRCRHSLFKARALASEVVCRCPCSLLVKYILRNGCVKFLPCFLNAAY